VGHDLQWDEKRSSEEGSEKTLAYENRQQLATTSLLTYHVGCFQG
jgi:hypothetical protein